MSASLDRERACAAALCLLPDMNPQRLHGLLRNRTPGEAWDAVGRHGVPAGVGLRPRDAASTLAPLWRAHAGGVEPGDVLARHRAHAVHVLVRGLPDWPDGVDHLDPPVSVVFARGDLDALCARRVALVGTRRATALGREVARTLGAELTVADVAVMSGLAWGIDAAAHQGALSSAGAAPIAVVGSGLDVPYPKANTALWHQVGARGLLLSEHPLGTGPRPHHFPLRNRILAAVAEMVVVVESHRAGGALITANLALDLGRTVGAVPGSLHNPAAVGANLLLRDGAVPVLDVSDVRTALGLGAGADADADADAGAPRAGVEQLVFEHLGEGATIDQLAARSGCSLDEVMSALDRLDEAGIVRPHGPVWRANMRRNR